MSSQFHPPQSKAEADPRRWLSLAVLLIASFMNLIDVTIVNVAIPSMQKNLGADASQIEWSDRRSSLVSLNKLGRTRAGEAMAAALAVNEAAFATLDADERAMFFDLLHRVIAALEADGKG